MGIEKIKNIFLGLIIFVIVFITAPKNFAADNKLGYQPVRVAIGNQKFQKYDYKTITVFGTADVQLYEKATHNLISTFPMDTPIEINLNNGVFELSSVQNEVNVDAFSELVQNKNSVTTPNNVVLECQGGLLGIKDLKRKGKQALYRTSLEIVKKPKTDNFYVVNVLDVQDYLKGVVPNEMPTSFGLEALKAQAVAARNYVLSPRTRLVNEYDVVDSVASQVYFGANTEETVSNRAVDETEGIVASYNWNLILAQYSSTAGGYTESFANAFSDPANRKFPSTGRPYLVAKPDMIMQQPLRTEEEVRNFYTTRPDTYDIRSPYYRWTKNWTKDELQTVLSKTLVAQSKTGFVTPKIENSEDFGELLYIKPRRRGDSGKLIDLDIITTKGTYTVQKELVIRRVFQKNNISLPSANVVFEFVNDETGNISEINAYGGGFGHGVGMSQYGAGFMGKELKLPYDKILKHYYTGINLGTAPIILSAYPSQRQITQKFYLDYKNANLIVDNKFNLSKINLIVNGREEVLYLSQGISPFRAPVSINISHLVKKGENIITFCYPLDEGSAKGIRLYVEAVNPNASKYEF